MPLPILMDEEPRKTTNDQHDKHCVSGYIRPVFFYNLEYFFSNGFNIQIYTN